MAVNIGLVCLTFYWFHLLQRSPKTEQDYRDLGDEIIESDLELDGEIIEPENDPLPQVNYIDICYLTLTKG